MNNIRFTRITVSLLAAFLAAVLYCVLIIVDMGSVSSFARYFLVYRPLPQPMSWLFLPATALLVWVVYAVFSEKPKFMVKVLMILVTGFILQQCFLNSGEGGLEGVQRFWVRGEEDDYLHNTGTNLMRVVRHYEELAWPAGPLCVPASTKPPGRTVFYMVLKKLVSIDETGDGFFSCNWAVVKIGAYLFPLLAALTVIPLSLLGKELGSRRLGLAASLFFVTSPFIMILFGYMDQYMFPLLAATSLWLLVMACNSRRFLHGAAAGVMLQISLFFSFSLIPVVCISFLYLIFKDGFKPGALKRSSGNLVSVLTGFVGLYLLLRIGAGYDALQRYSRAIEFHAQWKLLSEGIQWNAFYILKYFIQNTLEFSAGIGTGLVVLILYRTGALLRGAVVRKAVSPAGVLSLCAVFCYLLTGLAGRTVGEVSRLWLFMLPALSLLPAEHILIGSADAGSLRKYMLFAVLTQMMTAIVIKSFQGIC